MVANLFGGALLFMVLIVAFSQIMGKKKNLWSLKGIGMIVKFYFGGLFYVFLLHLCDKSFATASPLGVVWRVSLLSVAFMLLVWLIAYVCWTMINRSKRKEQRDLA